METLINIILDRHKELDYQAIKEIMIECNFNQVEFISVSEIIKKIAEEKNMKLPSEFFQSK